MLIQGDCLEEMKKLDADSVDCIVTDPPYGIGFDYGKGKKDVARSAEEYGLFVASWLEQAKRVARQGAFFAVWQPAPYFRHYWDWYGDEIHIYAACKNFVQLRKTPINYGFDPVVMFYKDGKPLRPEKPKRNLDFFVSNTAALVSKPDRIERKHPCPRPLDVVSEILANFTVEGGTVLDPFMGSGTTCLAAKNLGRKYIGIEREEEYFKIAEARVDAVNTLL